MKTKLLALGALFASLCISVQAQLVDKTPVLHLSFDQVSGTTAGSIVTNGGSGGSVMNGTLNASVDGTVAIVGGGKFGNCLQVTGNVDANDSSVRIANAVVPLNGNATWTVAMWIQTSTGGGAYAYQGGGGWAGGNTMFYLNSANGTPGGTWAGGVRNGQDWVQGTNALNDGLWHHIVITSDGTTRNVYVDGAFERTDGSWSGNGTGNQFWVGGSGNTGDGSAHLNGLVDEVYVFDKALSLSDIQALTNNIVPRVPVTVTVNPASGYRGQVFTVTATATPAVGTVTNATGDLSALNLSAAATMGQSSANVFTNTFTAPANAPVGARNVKVTVTSTEPLMGSAIATFTVVARPPTNAIILTQLAPVSAYEYTEASFFFGTTNDNPNDASFPMAYSWYTNSVLVSSNMGPYYTFLTEPADNGMQVYAIARVADTNFSSLTVTSAVVTLTVNPGSVTYTNGLKEEFFGNNATRLGTEIGDVGPGVVRRVTVADSPGGFGNNHTRRYSGFFIPPTNDNYVFFVAGDDDTDLFLSTDSTPAGLQLIAQENVWSSTRNWNAGTTDGFGSGSIASQKRSDQWTNSLGVAPYTAGIPLVAGQKYYLESYVHNGGGGDNWAITYQTVAELTLDPSQPTNGAPSRLTVASNNIALVTFPGTTISWVTQPPASLTVYEGVSTNIVSLATSDAEMVPNYQWYLNNTPFGGNSATLALNAIPASYNNAQIKVVASTVFGGLSTTSSVLTLTVIQSVFEPGWVSEKKWTNVFNITGAENGSLGTPPITGARPGFVVGLDNPSSNLGAGYDFNTLDSSLQQVGSFIAPSNGLYVFFISSHDGGNLFLSTDNTPANKRLIAQEAGWTSGWNWNTFGGGGSTVAAKRSDQFIPPGSNTPPYAAGISLTAGQRYYMELTHTTSRWGNERMGVTYRIMESGFVTPPTDGSLPNVGATNSGMSAIRCTYVAFTQQPANANAPTMGYATFSADGTTDGIYPIISAFGYIVSQPTNKLFFQWYKNGQPIPGATSKSLTLGPLMPSDHGATIYCTMRALGYANDALQPIWSNSTPATITITQQSVFEPGVLKQDWWTNTTSRQVVENGSVGGPHFSYTTPIFEGPNGLGAEGSAGNAPQIDYVNRISGFFVPPANDTYTFFTTSDDDSDFFISTDASPDNKRLVAQEAGWSGVRNWVSAGGGGSVATQKRSDQWSPDGGATTPYSSGISLTGGQSYYIEQVHHNGAPGGTHTTATFKGSSDPEPVNGDLTRFVTDSIGMYVPRIQWVAFLQQPSSPPPVVSGENSVTFTAAGTNDPSPLKIGTTDNPLTFINGAGGSALQYQWYKNGTPIPGANSSSYTLFPVLPSDHNAQFVVGLRALGYADNSLNRIWSNSVPAVLTVIPDNTPPTLTYAASFENTNQVPPHYVVSVTFSEWMNTTTLSNAANYTIAGVTITNVTVEANNRTVRLLVNQMPTLPLNITVNGVQDLSGNTIAPGSTTAINSEKLIFSDVGFPMIDPTYPSFVSVSGVGGYIITAQGSDIWNTSDGFHFAWETKTNDFDVAVRVVSQGHTHASAKAGLMVRESLEPYSRNWVVVNNPAPDSTSSVGANNVEANMRETDSGVTAGWKNIVPGNTPPMYPNAWVRLKRTGNVLSSYASSNMVNWVQLGSYDSSTNVQSALSNVVHVGICTTAHGNDTGIVPPYLWYNTAEYADYDSSFVPSAPPAVLTISRSGANVNVSWTPAGGHLEASPALTAPGVNWQNVGTANPAIVPIGAGPQFFRVVNP